MVQIRILVTIGCLLLLMGACKVKKATAIELIPFDYPDDMTEAGKPDFVKSYKQGHLIYNMNCAKCHNQTTDGKTVIPDFSLPQLMDYEIRIQYPDHAEPMRETNLSAEELDKVVLFLRYKKRNI